MIVHCKIKRVKLSKLSFAAGGDEPVLLLMYSIEKNRCYVGRENARRPIGLPFNQVFAFDSDRFSTLRKAWEEGKTGIFSDFTVDDFACNRYQDNRIAA